MGVFPARSAASFASSTSTQVTECPVSAKQVPATRPTYPVPTTAMRIGVRPLAYRRCVLFYHNCCADNPCTLAKQTPESRPLRKAESRRRASPDFKRGHGAGGTGRRDEMTAYSTVTLFARLRG